MDIKGIIENGVKESDTVLAIVTLANRYVAGGRDGVADTTTQKSQIVAEAKLLKAQLVAIRKDFDAAW